MREMLLKLISYHRKYDMGSWRPDDGVLQTHMVRWVMMSDADMQVLEEQLTAEQRHSVGLTIGKMWAEAWNARAETWDGNLSTVDNWSHVAETWTFAGWGKIDYNPRLGRIFVLDCVFSPETVAGTLEGMIGKPVKQVQFAYPQRASTRIYAFDLTTKTSITQGVAPPKGVRDISIENFAEGVTSSGVYGFSGASAVNSRRERVHNPCLFVS